MRAEPGQTPAEAERLLVQHEPLIRALASRVMCEYVSRDELIQAGRLGLILALQKYKPEYGVKLITYAVPWMIGEMRRCIRREYPHAKVVSFEKETDGEGSSLLDVLQGSSGVSLTTIDLHLALEKLKREAQLVICLRYFRDYTQKETAALLKKSQSQISRIEREALDFLRAHMT